MKKSYKHIGTCIFCGKSEPIVTFYHRPHTLPKSMGGRTIGFDVCDDCNCYFGTPDMTVEPHLSIEVCIKEILNVTDYLTRMNTAQLEGKLLPLLKSKYFSIYQSEYLVRFKPTFESSPEFISAYTECFKRGLYEIFLQEYHRQTKDGLNPMFDDVRRYARYGEGHLPVWIMQYNPIGIHFCMDESRGSLIPINEKAMDNIRDYGIFSLCIRGFWFYLAVTPKAKENGMGYLRRENDARSTWVFRGLEWLDDIHQIDFTLSRFNRN